MKLFRQRYWNGKPVSLPRFLWAQLKRTLYIHKNRRLRKRMLGMSDRLENGAEWEIVLPKEGDPLDKSRHLIVVKLDAPGLGRNFGATIMAPVSFKVEEMQERFESTLWHLNWRLAQAHLALTKPEDPEGFSVKWDHSAKERFKYEGERVKS